MRSTKASAAIERLKTRSGNSLYSMAILSDGRFALRLTSAAGQAESIGEPLPMDEFVAFVNSLQPEKPKRVSKLDVAFRNQLTEKR